MFLTLTQTLRAGCNLSVTNFGFLRKKVPMPLPEEIPAPETAVTNILAVQTSLISTLFPLLSLLSWQSHQYLVWHHYLHLFRLDWPYLNTTYSAKHKYQFRLDFNERHRLTLWAVLMLQGCLVLVFECVLGKKMFTLQLPNKYDFIQKQSLPIHTPLSSVKSWCWYKNNEKIKNLSPSVRYLQSCMIPLQWQTSHRSVCGSHKSSHTS